MPLTAFAEVKPWIPKLNIGGIGNPEIKAIQASKEAISNTSIMAVESNIMDFCILLQAIVKKEISSARNKNRSLKTLDRLRLENSIPLTAHRGLRMLCADELLSLQIDCPVNVAANEFACAKLADIRLDITNIQAMIEPILRELVNSNEDGLFDQVGVPLLELEKRIPGISDIAGKTITLLDIAEVLVGKQSGVDKVRLVLKIYRAMKTLADIFAAANDDGILLASSCQFKPSQDLICQGGA
jgi:hypothetical protein